MEEYDLGCLAKVKNELREAFCKPLARCFKGYTILCGIYTGANLLFTGLIPPIVKQHGDTINQRFDAQGNSESTTPEEIYHRLNIFTTLCSSLAQSFAFLCVINLILFDRWTKLEATRKLVKNALII